MTSTDTKRLAQSYTEWAANQIEAHPTADTSFEAYMAAMLTQADKEVPNA